MEGLATILTDVGSVLTSGIGWVGSVMETITSDPVLFIFCVGLPVAGFGVGLVNRLIRI